ncbi:MAG: glycosyltransferase [Lachnospiraceae bacterium]|nr:glycosyltransferase [Lachnospiraceae bacterium]
MYFSIIIPIFNVEKYLSQCLSSIENQTFHDYELILVDDGSTDGSGHICDDFKSFHDNSLVVHQKNAGQASARNAGLRLAHGEYVIFIDSDDFIISDDFLQDIYEKAQSTSSELIMYKFCKYYDGKDTPETCAFSMAAAEGMDSVEEILLSLVKNDAFYGAPWLKAIHRQVLVDYNIEFEEGLVGEDMEWMCHLLTCITSVSVIDKPYIAYRQREGSTSKTNKLKNLKDYIYLMKKWSGGGTDNSCISEQRREAFGGIMAKYYANLMICYVRADDPQKSVYYDCIKDMRFLLKFSMSKRPKMVHIVSRILGFRGALLMLSLLDKVKG